MAARAEPRVRNKTSSRATSYVAAAFNVIKRCADAIGAQPHSADLTPEQAMAHERRLFELGYA
jgi:hypothetical protein